MQEQWNQVEAGKIQGATKYNTKAKMLAAFIVDPSLTERYMQVSSNISWQEDMSRAAQWMSRKQLVDAFGESEGEEMISEGLVKACFLVHICLL